MTESIPLATDSFAVSRRFVGSTIHEGSVKKRNGALLASWIGWYWALVRGITLE